MLLNEISTNDLLEISNALKLVKCFYPVLAITLFSSLITGMILGSRLFITETTKKYYSGVNQFTYSHQHNGVKDRLIATANILVPPGSEIKRDKRGRIIPGDKVRFYRWAKFHITRHRQHIDIQIEDFQPIEDIAHDFTLINPNKMEAVFSENNQKIEELIDSEIDDNIEIDLSENYVLTRSGGNDGA